MQINDSARAALFDAEPGQPGGWLSSRSNDTVLREYCGLSLADVERVNRVAAQAGRDSLVVHCEHQGVVKLSHLPGWRG